MIDLARAMIVKDQKESLLRECTTWKKCRTIVIPQAVDDFATKFTLKTALLRGCKAEATDKFKENEIQKLKSELEPIFLNDYLNNRGVTFCLQIKYTVFDRSV